MQLLDPWMFIFYIMTGITLDKQFICKVTQNPQLTPTMYIQNVQGWHTYLVSCITWIIVDLTWNDFYYTKRFKFQEIGRFCQIFVALLKKWKIIALVAALQYPTAGTSGNKQGKLVFITGLSCKYYRIFPVKGKKK